MAGWRLVFCPCVHHSCDVHKGVCVRVHVCAGVGCGVVLRCGLRVVGVGVVAGHTFFCSGNCAVVLLWWMNGARRVVCSTRN